MHLLSLPSAEQFIDYITFSQVWALADSKRQGYLGYREFVTAMQVYTLFI
jgi:hypothetical protein